MGVAAAIGGGALAVGMYSSNKAAKAQKEGAQLSATAQTESTQKNIDFQKWLWGEQKTLSQPYVDAGAEGLKGYKDAINTPFTKENMELDPGYQFRLSEGLKGVENSAAAGGMQLSGRTLKGLGRYAQDYASGEFQNAYNRRQQGISNLYNLASMGQAAAAGQATQGGAMGSNISSSILQGGRAQAQMYSDVGNINAASAMAPFNSAMQVGSLAAQAYGAGAFSGGGGYTTDYSIPMTSTSF